MENDEVNKTNVAGTSKHDIDSQCAVNSLILDYYRKFGRKRDLEQFFSLSTAQSEIKDTSGLFWTKMKSENDSSDSGGRKSDSSAHELCRISIRCSMPDGSSSQSDDPKTKTESPHTESPPIITDDAPADVSRQSDDESLKSDDNSQKSFDPLLDLSANKPHSPTSSVTSQRKLEWDSLADVGYAYESDRKTSASSLSTLERLALKQQYSNNDSKQEIGDPTCHSTPVEESETKSKMKKGAGRKMTKIIKKDIDFVEVNVPHTSDTNPPQSINVNLTKHISFNVEKDGGITFDNIKSDVNISPPAKETTVTEEVPLQPMDKEIQTSLPKAKDKPCSSVEEPKSIDPYNQKIPLMISLNTIRKRLRRKKSRVIRRRMRTKKKTNVIKDIPPQEKSGEQLSEAESFEYMPGHIYNQNQIKANEARPEHNNTAGNKSSLESSGGLTTDSSKGSKHSLTQDLEKCIQVLQVTLQKRYDDSETKKKLIKDVVQRLLNSKYRDDDSTTDFLSGLSFNSKKLDLKSNNTTTSTSDVNNTDDSNDKRPRKSILRMEKFNSNVVASTSQSAPNLVTALSAEKRNSNLIKMLTSNSESDESSKGKISSDNAIPKTSSEELYLKYLEALRREDSYKRHLRDKERFLKQKLVHSDSALRTPICQETKINNRLKDLVKDLTRNNYDDGSGDASKLEGGSNSDRNYDIYNGAGRCQRSHSVFTLSSSHSESQKKPNLKKKLQVDRDINASTSRNHYCCCPHHAIDSKVAYADSSVQVNIKCQYENEPNERPKQNHSAKCPHCEKYEMAAKNTPCNQYDEYGSHEKPILSPRNVCRGCPICGKPRNMDIDENIVTYQQCPMYSKTNSKMVPNKTYGDNFCVCKDKPALSDQVAYQCSRAPIRGIRFEELSNIYEGSYKTSDEDGFEFIKTVGKIGIGSDSMKSDNTSKARICSQASQTNMLIRMDSEFNLRDATKSFVPLDLGKNIVMIHEATRCLQTEISINPRISDPTLSDIVIINNCVELVWEQHREVVRSSNEFTNQRKTSDVWTSSDSGLFFLKPVHCEGQIKDSGIMNVIESHDLNIIQPKRITPINTPNDYSIPIEGTNMTLVVSLPTKEIKENVQVSQAVGTEKPPIVDHGTCITAECSKFVQCQQNTPAGSTRSSFSVGPSSHKSSTSGKTSPRKPCLSRTSPSRSPQRNTYPKTVQIKDKKPLRRSNTDTGKLQTRCICCQTDAPSKTDPEFLIIQTKLKEVQTSDYNCQVTDTNICIQETDKKCFLKEIGIQKYSSDSDSCKKKSSSEKVKDSCEIKTPINVCCQTDAEEKLIEINSKNICGKCGNRADCCSCERVRQTSSPKKTKCGICMNVNVYDCKCKKSPETGLKSTKCEICDDELARCMCKKSKQSTPRNSKCDKCECDKLSGCSCEKAKKSSLFSKTKCCVCGSDDVCDCNRGQFEESSPKKIKCLMCGFEDVGICKCEKDQQSSLNKNKCGVCDSGVSCNCQDKTKQKPQENNKTCVKCGFNDGCECSSDGNGFKDPIIDMIKDITRRYSKTDIMKIKKKKRFAEIVTVLNYLLETEDSTDQEPRCVSATPESSDNCSKTKGTSKSPFFSDNNAKTCVQEASKKSIGLIKTAITCSREASTSPNRCGHNSKKSLISKSPTKKAHGLSESDCCPCKQGKSVHQSSKCTSKACTDSSDLPCSTDLPSTSESTACRILNKIKKECEKYHLRRNKCGRKCEISSSTSVNCDQCKKVHYCGCRYRCKRSKTVDKLQKKWIAYNLILQTSESMLSEGAVCGESRPLKDVVVKVPKKDKFRTETCKETVYEKKRGNYCSPRQRSRSCTKESELSSTDDFIRRTRHCTVRQYLEKNRPDFVEKCSERQNCLKFINELRANERATHRDLLSLHVQREPDLTKFSTEQLRELAQQIGFDIRQKRTAPKFISEREMKKHSKKIYKTLPEVVQKKEEKKKENIKKTNLLMANIFKKNLQKNTLRGSVNLSNYSTVIKI